MVIILALGVNLELWANVGQLAWGGMPDTAALFERAGDTWGEEGHEAHSFGNEG